MSSPKNVVVMGATGMIGGLVTKACLAREDVGRVTTIVRRPTGGEHPKLREVVHDDFLDYTRVADALADVDVCVFCVGVYSGQVPAAAFHEITVDYTVAFAKALREKSPEAVLCFLSGAGADPSGKSRMKFARDKGEAEKALGAMGFPRLHVFRPGYIYPVDKRREPNLMYGFMRAVFPVLRVIAPNMGVESVTLADAMVRAGLSGADKNVFENRDIRAF